MSEYINDIVSAAKAYGIDPNVALAIAARETGGDDVNSIYMADNGGLMQITPYSADDYGVSAQYPNWDTDPMQNALGGMLILSKKIQEQGGNVWAGVKAYNGAGPAADNYLSQVQQNYNSLGGGTPYAGVGGGTSWTYQARDSNGKPFINLLTHLRTSDPNEPFDMGSVMNIVSQQNPDANAILNHDRLTNRNYIEDTARLPADVAEYVNPTSKQLMKNRLDELNEGFGQQILQNNLQKGADAIQLINRSNNVDNKNAYASIFKAMGINVPSNADQYVKGNQILAAAAEDAASQRENEAAVHALNFAKQQEARKQEGLQTDLAHLNRMSSLLNSAAQSPAFAFGMPTAGGATPATATSASQASTPTPTATNNAAASSNGGFLGSLKNVGSTVLGTILAEPIQQQVTNWFTGK